MPFKPIPPEERLLERLELRGSCWLWTGGLDSNGYGQFYAFGRKTKVHIAAYRLWVGEVPDGLELDHTCHNSDTSCKGGLTCWHRRCFNPADLEPVTHIVNSQRGRKSGPHKTHCEYGHPIDGVYQRSGLGTFQRVCLTCRREQSLRAYYARKAK